VISRLRRANREQRKLLFSLGANFLTRIPGAVGLLWFLPRLRFGLGTDDYANLLASLALGTASAFLCGGFNTVGRRLIGEAYANNDREREANALASPLVANTGALILALAIIVACCWMRGGGGGVLVVAMLPAVATFLTTFDATRSAYNEHYVTATLLFVLQVAVYAVGFLVPTTSHSLVLGALVLQSAYVLTSLITFALLLGNRPYLVDGRPVDAWRLARKGTMLAIADGFVTATLSLSVVWLQTSSSATTSAWFATVVRLFQTFLVPVVLLLMPLSSYVRILWNGKSIAQQQAFARATLWMGLGYGAIVGAALFVASRLYVSGLLHLPAPGGFCRSCRVSCYSVRLSPTRAIHRSPT
jgi:hypothetical protein